MKKRVSRAKKKDYTDKPVFDDDDDDDDDDEIISSPSSPTPPPIAPILSSSLPPSSTRSPIAPILPSSITPSSLPPSSTRFPIASITPSSITPSSLPPSSLPPSSTRSPIALITPSSFALPPITSISPIQVQTLKPSVPSKKLPVQIQTLKPTVPLKKLPVQIQTLKPSVPSKKLPVQIQTLKPSVPSKKLPVQIQTLKLSVPSKKLPVQIQILKPSVPSKKLPVQIQTLKPSVPSNKLLVQIQSLLSLNLSVPLRKLQTLKPSVQIQKRSTGKWGVLIKNILVSILVIILCNIVIFYENQEELSNGLNTFKNVTIEGIYSTQNNFQITDSPLNTVLHNIQENPLVTMYNNILPNDFSAQLNKIFNVSSQTAKRNDSIIPFTPYFNYEMMKNLAFDDNKDFWKYVDKDKFEKAERKMTTENISLTEEILKTIKMIFDDDDWLNKWMRTEMDKIYRTLNEKNKEKVRYIAEKFKKEKVNDLKLQYEAILKIKEEEDKGKIEEISDGRNRLKKDNSKN